MTGRGSTADNNYVKIKDLLLHNNNDAQNCSESKFNLFAG